MTTRLEERHEADVRAAELQEAAQAERDSSLPNADVNELNEKKISEARNTSKEPDCL